MLNRVSAPPPPAITASDAEWAAWGAARRGAKTASGGALGARSAQDITTDASAPDAPAANEPPSGGRLAFTGCSMCIACAAGIAVFVVAIMNLHGSMSDFTTGAIFIGCAGFTIVAYANALHTAYKYAKSENAALADQIPWKRIALSLTIVSLITLAGGVLGVTGVINNQTLGWFYFAPVLASLALACCAPCIGAAVGARMGPEELARMMGQAQAGANANPNAALQRQVLQQLEADLRREAAARAANPSSS